MVCIFDVRFCWRAADTQREAENLNSIYLIQAHTQNVHGFIYFLLLRFYVDIWILF